MSLPTVVDKQNRLLLWRSLAFDLERKTISFAGVAVPATRAEFGLMTMLIRHRNFPMSKETVLDSLFGPGHGRDPRTVDMFVARLRHSFEVIGLHDVITAVPGRGYMVLDSDCERLPLPALELPAERTLQAA